MSLAHFISLQNKDPGFETFVNGKAIAHACEELEVVANKENVATIMSFYGKRTPIHIWRKHRQWFRRRQEQVLG